MKIELPKEHPYFNGRTCIKCNIFKSASEFKLEKNKRYNFGISMRSRCKDCERERFHKSSIKRLYDLDYEDYISLLKKQNYKCAICESKISNNARTSRLFVDHDHKTLKIRGLLCSTCNHGLGLFKDSPKLLNKAISYLTSDKD